ncbi:MAG: hypothetical protein L6R40_007379 [Gallowayella cf. fulva]|nr:MAG: hypothetical protein L6R40_007379 [Xanthomendoza cf. fulva]
MIVDMNTSRFSSNIRPACPTPTWSFVSTAVDSISKLQPPLPPRQCEAKHQGFNIPPSSQSFSAKYKFEKPNDRRALDLMNAAAAALLREIPDIVIAYGISDEYSFVFDRSSDLFDRRER